MATKYGWLIAATALTTLLFSCTYETEDTVQAPKGVRAYAEVTLGNVAEAETRVTKNYYDGWSISTFDKASDMVGMYAIRGRQNPDNLDDFTQSITNGRMYYEGATGTNSYRFGNSEYILDPTTVGNNYSILYYPYYEDMPDPTLSSTLPGLPIRQRDTDGIDKCIDFMYTNSSYISVSNNVMQPSFSHLFVNLILQRGEGFRNARCEDIWIVMKNPCTDIRIKQSSATSRHCYYLQYNPGEETADELMVDLMDEVRKADPSVDEDEKYMVNKYALWKTWAGNPYNALTSRYAIIPPGSGAYLNTTSSTATANPYGEIYFVLIQDDDGHWQRVSDFYLSSAGLRYGSKGSRYVLTIQLEGVNVVIRPSLVSWNDEVEITDVHKVGINTPEEYGSWVAWYNRYISQNRSADEEMITALKMYGDGVEGADGRMRWTFYINSDIKFSGSEIFPQIDKLDDVLEGTSTYTDYEISNIQKPLIRTICENGILRALEFRNVYLVQSEDETEKDMPYGAVALEIAGGTVERCNVVNGVLVSPNEVGMIAGKVTNGGTVKDCTVSGNIIGKSTAENYDGLFGIVDGVPQPTLESNKCSGLKFIKY